MKKILNQTLISKDGRVKSYIATLEKLINRLSGGDELIETLKQDSISEGFINFRIQEILESALMNEKENYIELLLEENEFLKIQIDEKDKEIKENRNKTLQNNDNSEIFTDQIKKIKQRYKRKFLKEKEKIMSEYLGIEEINRDLKEKSFQYNQKNIENTQKIDLLSKENEEIKQKLQNTSFRSTKKEIENENYSKKIENLKKENKDLIKKNREFSREIDDLKIKNQEILNNFEKMQTKYQDIENLNKNLSSQNHNELKILEGKKTFIFSKLRMVSSLLQDLGKQKEFLLNLQNNIKQTILFYFTDFNKELYKKLRNLNSYKMIQESKFLQKENERFLSELQKLRTEKTMFEARLLTSKKEYEKNILEVQNGQLKDKNELEKEIYLQKQQLQEKNDIIEKIKLDHAEEIANIKCGYLKEVNSLHNQLVKLNKNNETLAMKYEEELAFFQTNYLNDLRALKIEYRSKLETLLNTTKNNSLNSLDYTNASGGMELEEIQSTLRNLLKLADKKQEQMKKNGNKYGNIPLPSRESVKSRFNLKDFSNINTKNSLHSHSREREKSFESLKENI